MLKNLKQIFNNIRYISNNSSEIQNLKVVYFYHIPKCGGSYVSELLKKLAKAANGEFVSFNNLDKNKKIASLDENLIAFIGKIKDYSKKKVLLIHHHHGYPGIQELYHPIKNAKEAVEKKGGKMILICTVREPVSFHISRINYAIKRGSSINFERTVKFPKNHNIMSKYLLFNHIGRGYKKPVQVDIPIIEKNLQLFDYIYPIEKMEELVTYLNDFLETKNITVEKKINKGILEQLPTEKERAMLLDINYLDQHLYNLVRNREWQAN